MKAAGFNDVVFTCDVLVVVVVADGCYSLLLFLFGLIKLFLFLIGPGFETSPGFAKFASI